VGLCYWIITPTFNKLVNYNSLMALYMNFGITKTRQWRPPTSRFFVCCSTWLTDKIDISRHLVLSARRIWIYFWQVW
jgi:hypothetical protein